MKLKSWIKAFRLRTLPLSLSSILLGCFLAIDYGSFSWSVAVFATLTTLFLQVLSNLANDYGDFVKGVDNDDRVGPERSLQSGEISKREMFVAIIILIALSLTSGISLITVSNINLTTLFFFLLLGIVAIVAAIKYTVGEKAYGYHGFGDVFVYIFFGLTGVVGTYYLHTKEVVWLVLLPASSVGLLSMAVLNLNNMRDYYSDKKSEKNTLVVKLGLERARIYHVIILVLSVILTLIYSFFTGNYTYHLLYLIILPILFLNIKKVKSFTNTTELDVELKKIALATLLFVLTFGIGLIL